MRLIACLSALLCAVLGSAQAFGRFGYTDNWNVPGLVFTKEGFRSEHPSADMFRFPQALRQWKPIATSEWSQTVQTGDFSGSPSKLRQDLTALGVSAYFSKGMRLSLRCTSGPILTGSTEDKGWSLEANTQYATPPASWVLLSFRDQQPPILFTFQGKLGSLRLTGKTGEWVITSEGDLQDWVRICAPLGDKAYATNSVADLGNLAKACAPAIKIASQPAPVAAPMTATDEGPGVLGEWAFDRAGAVVPFPVFLSPVGGYTVITASKVKRLEMNTSQGPVFVTDEPKLALRFTVRRVPTGRALCLGAASGEAIGTASFLDVNSVVELALGNLIASQEKGPRDLAASTVAEFLTEAPYTMEPNTNQRLPFDGPGVGLDLTAAHAMLLQTTVSTVRATSEPNSLLTSLSWRRDWLTWRFEGADVVRRRRAGALAAIAYALAPEPERRVEAAMLQAGLAAERGLAIWNQRTRKGPAPGNFLETMGDLREDLFGKDDYRRKVGFGRAILSELRVFGDVSVTLIERDKAKVLAWTAPDSRQQTIILAAGYPLELVAGKNVGEVQISQGLGLTILRATPKAVGPCEATVKTPEWADPLPMWMTPPRFNEVER